jgi:ribose/xylose/arabinose/galactoside ABC-type transport system permease subunit
MEPLREIGRLLMVAGAMLAVVGALLVFSGKLPFRVGRLPGDISWRGQHSVVYFPVVTCVVVSVILSLVFWLISYFRK